MDGRDIGTVIAPHAQAKLYIEASPEVRAHRRWLELSGMGIEKDKTMLLAEILARDEADRTRPISPLRPAGDAALLDTTNLDIDAAFAAALALVSPKIEPALKDRHRG
jgi:cytidylate kinase